MIRGVDLYFGNGPVNPKGIKADGFDFTIYNACEGATITDPMLSENLIEDSRDAELVVPGVYAFTYPENGSDWKAECEHYLTVCEKHNIDWDEMLPILDLETKGPTPGGPWVKNYTTMLEKETGREGWLYCGPYFWDAWVKSNDSFGWDWWAAAYPTIPYTPDAFEGKLVLHQYSATGGVAGVGSRNVDKNTYAGTIKELEALCFDKPKKDKPKKNHDNDDHRHEKPRGLEKWKDSYLDGKPGNVTDDVKKVLIRAHLFDRNMYTSSTTGGTHAPSSWHYSGRAGDVAIPMNVPGAVKRMGEFQEKEFERGLGKYKELFGPINNKCIKNGQQITLGEGTGLENLHDNHVHVAP